MSTSAAASGYMVKLKDRREVADHTMAFYFEKPIGWTFKAGQYVEVTVPHIATDTDGSDRVFSIASAPHEEDVMVATRMRGTSPKKILGSIPLGASVKLDGPFGNMILHNNAARPAVFLAGGIGVTPFRSMAFRAARERLPHRVYMFHANRRPEDAPFFDELQTLERNNPNYRYIPVMTQPEKSSRGWQGRIGHLDWVTVSDVLKDATARGPIYYIAGPPGMVHSMQTMLNTAGVDDDDIRAEEFSGY